MSATGGFGVQMEEPALKNPPDVAVYIARKTGHLAENGFHSRIRRLEWRVIHFVVSAQLKKPNPALTPPSQSRP
jgi:hypothetical protein